MSRRKHIQQVQKDVLKHKQPKEACAYMPDITVSHSKARASDVILCKPGAINNALHRPFKIGDVLYIYVDD